jgi:hypothetical protein
MGQAEVSRVSERARQGTDATGGERRDLWWAEASVWTERMVSALANGVRGGKWLNWPNAFFAQRGLFTLQAAHARARHSR